MRDCFQSLLGHAGNEGGGFHCERLQTLSVVVESVHPLIEELGVRKVVVKQIAADCIQPEQVCTWLGMQEEVRAPCHFMFTQIRDNELLPVQFVSALHPGGNDRMTLRCVAANDENKVSFLHVGDGTRISAVADSAE